MTPVFLSSPYAGDREANLAYLRRALAHSLRWGEAPFAPHGLYPLALEDTDPAGRDLGIMAGLTWIGLAEKLVAYIDRGISPGMVREIFRARLLEIPVELRCFGHLGLVVEFVEGFQEASVAELLEDEEWAVQRMG